MSFVGLSTVLQKHSRMAGKIVRVCWVNSENLGIRRPARVWPRHRHADAGSTVGNLLVDVDPH